MKLEILATLLETPRTGKPCGASTRVGPCQTEGFEPCGRCHEHGAVAMLGIKRPRTKAERAAVRERVRLGLCRAYGTPSPHTLDAAVDCDRALLALLDEVSTGVRQPSLTISPTEGDA